MMQFLLLIACVAEINLITAVSLFEDVNSLDDVDADISYLTPTEEPNTSDMAFNWDSSDPLFQADRNTEIFPSADLLSTDLNTLWGEETLLTDTGPQVPCTSQTDGPTLEARGSSSCAPKEELTLPPETLQLLQDPEEALGRLGRPKGQFSGPGGRPPFDNAAPIPFLDQLRRPIERTGSKDESGCNRYRVDGPIIEVCCDGPAIAMNLVEPERGTNLIDNCDPSACFSPLSLTEIMLISCYCHSVRFTV
jgi:hypothetical protein